MMLQDRRRDMQPANRMQHRSVSLGRDACEKANFGRTGLGRMSFGGTTVGRIASGRIMVALVLCTLFSLVVTPADAVRTRFFSAEGYQDFKKFKLDGVSLGENGQVQLSLATHSFGDPGARTIWKLAVDSNDRIVASSGDQGKVFRLEKESLDPLASLYNYELFALTSDGSGFVYAAGAPAGTVVRLDSDGKAETIFTAPEGLIFDLLPAPNGDVFAASGERGLLYRIQSKDDAEVVVESGDIHIRCLAWSPDGKRIWMGTDGRGLIEEVDPKSKTVKILYDAAENEIVSLAPLAEGGLIFAANPGPQGVGAPGGDNNVANSAPAGPVIYKLSPSGSVRELWNCPEKVIHDLLLEEDGSILVATGTAGAVYRVAPDGQQTVVWRSDEEQILDLLQHKGRLYAATGNPGRVYQLGPEFAREATLTSDVLDAKDQARWGKLSWQLDGESAGLVFETRSGFTAVPDPSWTKWGGTLDDPKGSQISSAPGRYLQWRAKFAGDGKKTPVLRSVRVPYLAPNRPPRIEALSLSSREPPFRKDRGSGGVSQTLSNGVQVDYSMGGGDRANTLPPGGVPTWVRQLRSIVWQAEDPDRDRLTYSIEIRQLGEKTFRIIEEEYEDSAYTLETGMLPDGTYEIRITASDGASNVPGDGQTAVRVSPPFHVDNAPPTVLDLKTRRGTGVLQVTGRAVDGNSPLRSLEVSVDGGPFRGIQPSDGLLDSVEEQFDVEVPLKDGSQGNWVVVQVRDAAGNHGSFRAWLQP